MKAAVVVAPGKFATREVPNPVCPEDGVVVRVRATTICASDLKRSYRTDLPIAQPYILGHEMAGEVFEVGKKVNQWKVGQRVAVSPRIFCGHCRPCLAGFTNLCLNTVGLGFHLPGSFAEYFAVPAGTGITDAMVAIPDDLSFEGASIAEPLACALNGLEVCHMKPGATVVIIGMGCQGVMQAQAAKKCFAAGKVIGVMRSEKRSEIVRECGPEIDELIFSSKESPREKINQYTDGKGADVVIVSASSGEALTLAMELISLRGTLCIHASIPAGEEILKADANRIHYEEITITGSSSFKQGQYLEALELVRKGVIDAEKFVSRKFSLEGFEEGVSLINNRELLKAAINP